MSKRKIIKYKTTHVYREEIKLEVCREHVAGIGLQVTQLNVRQDLSIPCSALFSILCWLPMSRSK